MDWLMYLAAVLISVMIAAHRYAKGLSGDERRTVAGLLFVLSIFIILISWYTGGLFVVTETFDYVVWALTVVGAAYGTYYTVKEKL